MRKAAQLLLGLAVAALFLWLALRHVDFAALLRTLQETSLTWLVLAPLVLGFGYVCRILRWRMMLALHNPEVSVRRSGMAFLASIAVNNLLPFRLGDVLRCFGFSRWLNVPPGPVLATVLVERLLDLGTLILALAIALWALSVEGGALNLARSGAFVLGSMAFLALLLLLRPVLLKPFFSLLASLADLIGPGAKARTQGFLDQLLATLLLLAGRKVMPALMGWSVLVWFFEGATYLVVAKALPALPAPEAAWLAMPMGTLSTLLPSTPGHVGTFDYFCQLATVAAGNPLAEATAFVLLVHLALWLPTTLAGGLCLLTSTMPRRVVAE
jgi:uncharacterized protein (TIRG00374 family)